MTGSSPASTPVWKRAIGVSPSCAAFSDVINNSAAAPSLICEELPAWTVPSARKTGLRARQRLRGGSPPQALVGLEPATTGQVDGGVLPGEPAGVDRAIGEFGVRRAGELVLRLPAEAPLVGHHLGADPWLNVGDAVAVEDGIGIRPAPKSVLATDAPSGTRLITSTPPATTTSYCPDINPAAAKWTDCCEEPHCRSIVVAGTASKPAGGEDGAAADVDGLRPDLHDAPQITSSSDERGSTPLRSAKAPSTCAERSWRGDRGQ